VDAVHPLHPLHPVLVCPFEEKLFGHLKKPFSDSKLKYPFCNELITVSRK
jgi:hypothetical protein